jgi:NO-binding membrane sensor protein with MHYT domain
VSFGAIIGWIDLQASEVQPVVLLLLVSTALLGFAQPPRAWLWALIIGGGILAAHLIGPLVGFNPAYEVKPNVLVTLIALIPAFIGAYIGAFIGWSVQKQH